MCASSRCSRLIAAVPAILVAVVASVTLDRGLDPWFSQPHPAPDRRTRWASPRPISASTQRRSRGDIVGDGRSIVARAKPLFDQDRDALRDNSSTAQAQRARPAAVADRATAIAASSSAVDARTCRSSPPRRRRCRGVAEERAAGRALPRRQHVAAASIKLRGYRRRATSTSRARSIRASSSSSCATQRERRRITPTSSSAALGVQIAFALMYTVIALIVLLSAVWIGLNFANRLVAPIRRLIGAADVVSTGNLYVQVPVRRAEGDLGHLGETFNKMTPELRTQRDDLIARARPDRQPPPLHRGGAVGRQRRRHRRRRERRITHPQPLGREAASAQREAERARPTARRGRARACGRCSSEARSGLQRLVQGQITINRNGRERNLSVRVTTEQSAASRARLRRHARRHHRSRHGAAHVGLGRRRAPHRA